MKVAGSSRNTSPSRIPSPTRDPARDKEALTRIGQVLWTLSVAVGVAFLALRQASTSGPIIGNSKAISHSDRSPASYTLPTLAPGTHQLVTNPQATDLPLELSR